MNVSIRIQGKKCCEAAYLRFGSSGYLEYVKTDVFLLRRHILTWTGSFLLAISKIKEMAGIGCAKVAGGVSLACHSQIKLICN